MRLLNDLATVFQVGTHRTEVPFVSYLPDLPVASAERRALMLAGALGLMKRAGAESTDVDPIAEAPPETARIAEASAAPLAEALASGPAEVVLEWAEKARRLGKVTPANVLEPFMQLAIKHPKELGPALGSRGRWLASLRGLDQELAGAETRDYRQWIQAEYESLDWKERASAIAGLASDLRAEDEAALLVALRDRRKEVREAAANLVVRLPQSEASRELKHLTEGLFSLEKSLLRKRLVAKPPEPESLPKWLPRTSFLDKAGPKALALYDLLQFSPPERWAFLGLTIDQLLDLAKDTEYVAVIQGGLTQSALRFHHQEWIDALFVRLYPDGNYLETGWNELCQECSESVFAPTVMRYLAGKDEKKASSGLASRRKAISPALSKAAAESSLPTTHYGLPPICAFHLDSEVLPILLNVTIPEGGPDSQHRQLCRILDLRRRLLASLDQP